MNKTELAQTAKDIISDMFRWGYIKDDMSYIDLDLRTISDDDAINVIRDMKQNHLIDGDYAHPAFAHYYVPTELLKEFELTTNA